MVQLETYINDGNQRFLVIIGPWTGIPEWYTIR